MIEAGARPAARLVRAVPFVAAAALLLGACGAARGAHASSSRRSRSAGSEGASGGATVVGARDRCQAANLRLGVSSGIGTSHRATVYGFQLTNIAKTSCVVLGYPGLSIQSISHATLLGTPARLGPASGFPAPVAVRLAPRASAWFVGLVAGSPSLECHAPVSVSSFPPDGNKELTAWLPLNSGGALWHRARVCTGEDLSVSAVAPEAALAKALGPAASVLRASVVDPATGPGPCQASQLALTVGLSLDPVGAGSRTLLADELMYRNRSGSACVLTGYPGLGFLDSGGHAIPVTVEWPGINSVFGKPVPHLVEPGAALVAVFEVSPVVTTNIVVPGCRTPVTVESYPPNSYAPLATSVTGKGSSWSREWRRFGCDGTGVVVSVSRLMHPSTLAASEQAVAAGFLGEHFS